MAKPAKRKVPGGRVTPSGGGRVTPKGTRPVGAAAPISSPNYSAPTPQEWTESPKWVPILMFTLLGLGCLVIVCNYLGVLPGGADTWYLVVGLVLILGGIITATQFR